MLHRQVALAEGAPQVGDRARSFVLSLAQPIRLAAGVEPIPGTKAGQRGTRFGLRVLLADLAGHADRARKTFDSVCRFVAVEMPLSAQRAKTGDSVLVAAPSCQLFGLG